MAASASRFSSATKTASCRGAPRPSAMAGARAPTTPPTRRPVRRRWQPIVRAPDTPSSPAQNERATPSARTARSTTPLTSKKSTFRVAVDQCSAAARSTPARRARVSPSREVNRAPSSNKRDIAASMTAVVRDGVDEARQQRRTQRVEFRRQRVRDAHDRVRRREGLRGLRLDEPERDGFRQPGRREHAADERSRVACGSGAGAAAVHRRKRRLERVEAVVPADFFDEVHFAQQIHAERRRR